MTLIVARIQGKNLQIDSDNIITDPNESKGVRNIQKGIIKTIILNGNLSVSYAGDVEYAQKTINEIYELNDFSLEHIKNKLLNANINSSAQVDFILATTENQPLLYKISEKTIEESDTMQWIGDKEGYSIFQSHYLPNIGNQDEFFDSFYFQSMAFEEVINNINIKSVGGFHICVRTIDGNQQYPSSVKVVRGSSLKIQGPELQPMFANCTTEDGSYVINYISSSPPFHPLLGIYFTFGRFGIIFYPRFSKDSITIRNVSVNDFRQEIRKRFKIETSGLTFNP